VRVSVDIPLRYVLYLLGIVFCQYNFRPALTLLDEMWYRCLVISPGGLQKWFVTKSLIMLWFLYTRRGVPSNLSEVIA
jgi:hypothetical protein